MTKVVGQHGRLLGLALVMLNVTAALLTSDGPAAFRLPRGFVMELFADEKLANDIYAMTLDEQGHVIVTSAGYIKRLQDTDGDGRADQATVLATPRSGGMGLFCDGEYVYYCGDGWLSRYQRVDDSGRLADEPEKIIPLAFGEHGGHAVRKGPDGWWYVIAGNDARVTAELVNDPNSPIRRPEAGCLLRLRPPPAGKGPWQVQVVAHGFRNPYDFDFGPAGEMFTYDSDVERTFLLPWYVPTRIYHIAWSAHHGWRLPGYLRSWARCDDYLDNVEMLWAIGRGSPTGVVVYRHRQFPQKYHEGLFVADWTFGRIYFVPLVSEGATFRGQAEVFLEPTGLEGFAPTDLAVGKDGELFVCIGGRRTRGAVYRIRYLGPALGEPQETTDLDKVLRAPQPLEAWSRARWQPLARQLGKAVFLSAARDGQRAVAERVRAVEILTELFGGLDYETAHALAQDRSELVRSATAWSLGCLEPTKPSSGNSDTRGESKLSRAAYAVLINLARNEHPRVRCRALEALRQHKSAFPERQLVEVIVSALDNRDKRVRQSAARLASQLSEPAWRELWEKRQNYPANARLTLCLAYCWREPAAACLAEVVMEALSILESNSLSEATRFDAVRMIMLACGDWELDKPPVEILTGYTLRHAPPEALRKRLTQALHHHWPGSTSRWNQEAARLLAMLRDDSPELPRKLASFWKADSDPTWDVHYLIVLACARAAWPDQLAVQVAHVLVQLHERLEGKHLRVKLTWGDRLAELVHLLIQRDSQLAQQLARHPMLVQPSHVVLALALPDTERAVAASRFYDQAMRDPAFLWTPPLLELFTALPTEKAQRAFRRCLDDPVLRYPALTYLAQRPEEQDREAYLEGLAAPQPEVARLCLDALERLPISREPKHLALLLRGLRSWLVEPRWADLRQRIARLYGLAMGLRQVPNETKTDSKSLRETYRQLWDSFLKHHPNFGRLILGDEEDTTWRQRLARIDWSKGNAARGEKIFRERGCITCHTGTSRIGPDLAGVTSRFSREDLFEAILFPSRDVAPAYRLEIVETSRGQVYSGIVIFESADGIILQTDALTTLRLATEDILRRSVSSRSLMPDGLLRDLDDRAWADLYAFLQTLSPGTILPP